MLAQTRVKAGKQTLPLASRLPRQITRLETSSRPYLNENQGFEATCSMATDYEATNAFNIQDETEVKMRQDSSTGLKRSNAIRRMGREKALLGDNSDTSDISDFNLDASPPDDDVEGISRIEVCSFAQAMTPKEVIVSAQKPVPTSGLECVTGGAEENSDVDQCEYFYDAVSRTEEIMYAEEASHTEENPAAPVVLRTSSLDSIPMWSSKGKYIPRGVPKGRVAKFVETGLEVQSEVTSLVPEKAALEVETPTEKKASFRDRLRRLWKKLENEEIDATGSLVEKFKAKCKAVSSCLLVGCHADIQE